MLDDNLRELLSRAKALHGRVPSLYVLPGRRGRPLHKTTVGDWWRDACAATGVEGVVWHDLRAKAATDADAQGTDATKLLGHADKRSTQMYLRGLKVNTVEPLRRRKM